MKILIKEYNAPCGILSLGSFNNQLCMCDWQVERHHALVLGRLKKYFGAEFTRGSSPVLEKAALQLDEYFIGNRSIFDVSLHLVGTEFQKRVWQALLQIPYGHTITYGTLAMQIGKPTSARAVAAANGANAISIFIPCHRVNGSDGSLTGYSGGLVAKQHLLSLEKKHYI